MSERIYLRKIDIVKALNNNKCDLDATAKELKISYVRLANMLTNSPELKAAYLKAKRIIKRGYP